MSLHFFFVALLFILILPSHPRYCQTGYYGSGCTLECSKNCNPLPNGDIVCDKNTGECPEGCEIGFHGSTCNRICSDTCVRNTCNQHNGHCTLGCKENYCGDFCDQKCSVDSPKVQPCRSGFYGFKCALQCSINCKPLTNGEVYCHPERGECVNGCLAGFYGVTCSDICSQTCLRHTCNQHNGYCTEGCTDERCGDFCENICTTEKEDESSFGTIYALGFGLGIPLLVLLIIIIVCLKCFWKRPDRGHVGPGIKMAGFLCNCGCFVTFVALTLAHPNCDTCLYGVCDVNGACTQGCVTGYADKYCRQPCQPSCRGESCVLDDTGQIACTEGCKDGYCGTQCKSHCSWGCLKCDRSTCKNCTYCRDSHYGKDCQNSCYDTCSTHVCDKEGKCLDSCLEGLYGQNCEHRCNARYRTCRKEDGECVKCTRGYYGDLCQLPCPVCVPRYATTYYKCQHGCEICTDDVLGYCPDMWQMDVLKDQMKELVKNEMMEIKRPLYLSSLFVGLLWIAVILWVLVTNMKYIKQCLSRPRWRICQGSDESSELYIKVVKEHKHIDDCLPKPSHHKAPSRSSEKNSLDECQLLA